MPGGSVNGEGRDVQEYGGASDSESLWEDGQGEMNTPDGTGGGEMEEPGVHLLVREAEEECSVFLHLLVEITGLK